MTARPRKSTSSTAPKTAGRAGELDFTYYSAVYTVENALSKVKDEKGMKRVEKFLREDVCPDCGGTRLSEAARAPKVRGISLDEACKMTLTRLNEWVAGVPGSLPEEMRPMAESICASFTDTARRLLDLGWGTSPSTGRPQPSRPANGSGCSWPGRSATGQPGCCMCWTSRRSGSIPEHRRADGGGHLSDGRPVATAIRSSSSTTTPRSSRRPTG